MAANVTHRFRFEMPVNRRVIVCGGGGAVDSVPAPPETATVEVEIDMPSLVLQLGHKAVGSKGGKAQEIGGAVVVRHLRPKKS